MLWSLSHARNDEAAAPVATSQGHPKRQSSLRRLPPFASPVMARVMALGPGIALCAAVAAGAYALQAVEDDLFGRAWLEALVLAILLGTAVRTAWKPAGIFAPGIAFSAKILLEVAVVLLGASVSAETVLSLGGTMLGGIAVVVAGAIVASFGISRALGLPVRMALLVACGNSICGNSAIAAVAPIIAADSDDVAASIAFTAVLGVVVVLAMPLICLALDLTTTQSGALAGLTVYAVPQVLAAAAPMGAAAIAVGTLVKLVRVLMLGPVCVILSMLAPRIGRAERGRNAGVADARGGLPPLTHLVPWFIIGFVGLLVLRSAGAIPTIALSPMARSATLLTVLSMAGLGLGVDIRVVAQAGGRVTAAVVLSLVAIGVIGLVLIRATGLA